IDNGYIIAVSHGRLYCIDGYRSRVGTHGLCYHTYPHTLSLQLDLDYRRRTASIRRAQYHFIACLFKLIGQFAYGGGLPYADYSYYHNHIRLMVAVSKTFKVITVVFSKKSLDFFFQQAVKFIRTDILISGHTVLNTFDN